MYQEFKKQFITYAMVVVSLVLFSLVAVLNMTSYRDMYRRADFVTQLISEHDGYFPKDMSNQLDAMVKHGLSSESPYSTRYFSVFSLPGRDILRTNRDNIVSISGEEIQAKVYAVMSGDETIGDEGRFRFRKTRVPDGTLTVFLDMTQSRQVFIDSFKNSLWLLLAALLLVWMIIWLLAGKAIRPIVATIEKQKVFVNDAGHELKTPLSIISSSADVIELTHGKDQWTDSIHRQVKRMDHLIQDMLMLSHYDQLKELALTKVDLVPLLEEMAEELFPMLKDKQLHLKLELPETLWVEGNQESLSILFRLLLDNAIRYTDSQESITVRSSSSAGSVTISITNPYPDFPEEQLEAIFERFYRADTSRSRHTGGSGIGLALARTVAQANGADLKAIKPDSEHISFKIQLRQRGA